ncbi:MAG TPA: hypothetical protein VIM71_03460 [Lacunisphaera sp.]
MQSAHRVVFGVVLACALGLVVHHMAAPRPLPPITARSPAATPARASVKLGEPAPPLPSEPPLSSPDEEADQRLLLARRCLALAESDPLAAMEIAFAHCLQNVDSSLLANLMIQWAKQDFEGAYEWSKTQEPGVWRDDTLARLAYLRAPADPLAAARIVVTDMSAGPARNEAIISVVHQWAIQDREAAGLWAQSLADQTLRQRASAEVAGIAAMSAR